MRGAYFNWGEMVNFLPLSSRHTLIGLTSNRPIHSTYSFPIKQFFCPADLPDWLFGNKRIKFGILNRLFGDAMMLVGLENYFREEYERGRGIDIAHTAETYFYFTQQCLDAKKKGYVKKVVVTVWETIPFNHEGIRGRKEFKQRTIREADHFLAVTERAKEALIQEGCPKEKITVIPMGVDIKLFTPCKGSPCEGAGAALSILFVGRLEKEKGVWVLLEAVKNLYKTHKEKFRVTMIGEGSQKGALIDAIREVSLKEVVEIKSVDYFEIQKEYQQADIFVLPSLPTKYWEEQYGMVLVEAMASGLPIIGSDSGAIPEVLGDAGIIVPHGNVRKLTGAIAQMVENKKKRVQLGKKSLERARIFFDNAEIFNKIEKLY